MHKAMPLLALALLVTACGRTGDKGGAGAREFPLSGFDRVAAAGPDDVEVTTGAPFKVTADGDEAALDKLELEVKDGELSISRSTGASLLSFLFGGNKGRAHVRVAMPGIRAIKLAGAGKVSVDRVMAPTFEGAISGAGDLQVAGLRVDAARFTISGAGNLDLAGTASRLGLKLSGAGHVRADQLTAGDIAIDISGVGDVKARATGRASGQVSGVGNVEIAGTTQCDIQRSGVGSVKCAL